MMLGDQFNAYGYVLLAAIILFALSVLGYIWRHVIVGGRRLPRAVWMVIRRMM